MERRTYIIFALIVLLLLGSFLALLLFIDQTAYSAMAKVISNLQEKTLALSRATPTVTTTGAAVIHDAQGRTVIYDIFVRDGICYLVSTYWHSRDPPLRIVVEGREAEEIGYNEYEPVRYFRVPVTAAPVTVTIDGAEYRLAAPAPTVGEGAPKGLAVATLFKRDYAHIRSMIEWYRAQGVETFYLYFNGPALPPGLPIGPGIQYRLWNFQFWNYTKPGWGHAAQTAFLTTARLRHMPDHSWIGLVDIDECVANPTGPTVAETLAAVPAEYNVVRVRNRWAFKLHDRLIYTTVGDPATEWEQRTKCFYRGSYTGLCGIHQPKPGAAVIVSESLLMLHVVNYSHMERLRQVAEPRASVAWPTAPTDALTAAPTDTPQPTAAPTDAPTAATTDAPTAAPTDTSQPTAEVGV